MRKYTCDIAILGAGSAGLMAAARAAEAGLGKIALFEKGTYFGGSFVQAGGFFTTDTPDSDDLSSEENAYALYKEYLETLHYTGNTQLQKNYIFQTRYMSKFLADIGVEMKFNKRGCDYIYMAESPKEREGGKRLGAMVIEALDARCRELGIDMFLKSSGKNILLDDSGTVTGVIVDMDGETVEVAASIVVLACGGVTGDYAQMCKYFPQYFAPGEDVTSKAARTNSGDGIEMAAAVGAETGKHMGIHLLSPTFNHGALVVSAVIQNPSCIWVNLDGVRITNEALTKQSQEVINRNPKRCIFAIADANIKKDVDALVQRMPPRIVGKNPQLDAAIKTASENFGNALVADSLKEVADFIGCEYNTLVHTIQEYNGFCEKGFDSQMLKDPKFLKPLEAGPYYVVRAGRYCDCSQGGITVDEKLRVLKENGEVIPGLYAMGDNAGGFVSEFYFGGAGATFSLTSGYMSDTFFKEYLSNL